MKHTSFVPALLAISAAVFAPVRLRGACILATAVTLCGLVVAIGNAGDWMMDSRLLTPYAPTMFLLALVAIVGIGERSAAARAAVAFMFLLAIPTLLRPEILAEGVRGFAPTWQASARNPRSYPYPLVGNMPEATVADVVRTGDVVALEAGGLPAFILLDTRIIELQGLTDRQLARASADSVADPQFGKRNWVEVLRRRPHFINMHSSIWRHAASNRRAAPLLDDYHVVLTTMPIPIEHFHDYYYYRVVNPRAHTLLVRTDHPGLPRLRETHPHCSMAEFLRRNGSCS